MVFNICKKLSLPQEVKYAALELFNQFMTKHIMELREIVLSSSSEEKQVDWNSVEKRVCDQVVLRAMTCVQIASKMISHYKAMKGFVDFTFEQPKTYLAIMSTPYTTPSKQTSKYALPTSKVKRYLSACGLQYSLSSVFKSELRVLKTLSFRISTNNPLTYIELLLEVLQRNCPGLEVSFLHKVSTKIMDLVCFERKDLYHLLCRASGAHLNPKNSNDVFLMATCVIVAAGYIIDQSTNDLLIEQISLITCLEEADIIIYSTMLVRLALDING